MTKRTKHAAGLRYYDGLYEHYQQQQSSWTPFRGPRGGSGWRNTATGEVLYQEQKPGEKASSTTRTPSLTREEQTSAPSKGKSEDDLNSKVLSILRDNPMDLRDLATATGVKAGRGQDPLKSPLNRALVELRDQGKIKVSERRWGDPVFELVVQ